MKRISGSEWFDRLYIRRRLSIVVGIVCLLAGFAGTAQASVAPVGTREVPGTDGLYGVSCATANRCIAVGVASFRDGLGQHGVVVPITDGIAGSAHVVLASSSLGGVSCPSARTCVAVGSNRDGKGVVVPITDGGLPGTAQVVGEAVSLNSVSCSSDTTCIAVGQSTSMRGVVLPVVNGAAGNAQEVEGTYSLGSVSCGSPVSCQAVGQMITTEGAGVVVSVTEGKPGIPQTLAVPVALSRVSCADASTCFAIGMNRDYNKAGGTGVVVPIIDGFVDPAAVRDGIPQLDAISCITTTTCQGVTGGRTVSLINGLQSVLANVSDPASLFDLDCFTADTCQAVGQYVRVTGISVGVVSTFNPGALPTQAPVATLTLSPNATYVGQPVDLAATISPVDATGTITFFGGSIPGCVAVPIVAGAAHCVTTFSLDVSTFLTASYSGDAQYNVTSAAAPFGVMPAPPTLLQIIWGYLIGFLKFFHLFGL